jgi:SAM-dependent methyltransferase
MGTMLTWPALPGTEQIAVHDPNPDSPNRDYPISDNPSRDFSMYDIPNQDNYRPLAVQRVYDGMAADYAVRFGSELAAADQSDPDIEFLDEAVRAFPDGYAIDVGCGPAQVSRFLIERGRTVISLDFATAMLAQAARLVPQAGLVAADLMALPLRPASCAAAVASYSLHHLPKALLGDALAGLREVLSPGGVLVIITHGGSGEELLDRPEGQLVLSRYAPDELADRLRSAGLTPELLRTRPPRPGEYPAEKIRITARRQ